MWIQLTPADAVQEHPVVVVTRIVPAASSDENVREVESSE